MHKPLKVLTRHGIFTSVLAGTITYLLGFAMLDHWAYSSDFSYSLAKGIGHLPLLFLFILLIGFLAEVMRLFYGIAFSRTIQLWFLNDLRVYTGIIVGFFTGLTVGAIGVFFQEILKFLFGIVMLWR